jgi:lipopolysaccharide export LptBFGC system permease protein LptF
MSTDVLPETWNPQRRSDQDSSSGRWWKRILLAIAFIAVVALAVALIPRNSTSQEIGSELTHTIMRGDLIVSVTEQGTLESADNTEICCAWIRW